MNEIELCAAIRQRLKVGLKNMQLKYESAPGMVKQPNIVDGFLPPKRQSDVDDFPWVIVRPVSGRTDGPSSSVATIWLGVGTYCDTDDGHNDVLLVIAEIRRLLLEQQSLAYAVGSGGMANQSDAGSIFRLQFPMDWEVFEDQPDEFWVGHIITRWEVPTPQERLGDDL